MFKSLGKIFYHVVILTLSAIAALSLPYVGRFIADHYITYWSLIESEKVFLITVEIILAVLLIIFFNYLGKSWKDRRLSAMAEKSGLVHVTNTGNVLGGERIKKLAARRIKKLKEAQSLSKDVMFIGSTGFSTIADRDGDLHNVIRNCREAKIMLLNPFGEGANIRAKSIPVSDVTPESFKSQIMKSIDYLKGVNEIHHNIRLKFYPDAPLFKLAVLGDYISMKFYHAGTSTRETSEHIFRHTQDNSSLYGMFYQLFLSKWRDASMPEYDFNTGELVYRDDSGNEIRREELDGASLGIESSP